MSRSGYTEDCEGGALGTWRAQVASVVARAGSPRDARGRGGVAMVETRRNYNLRVGAMLCRVCDGTGHGIGGMWCFECKGTGRRESSQKQGATGVTASGARSPETVAQARQLSGGICETCGGWFLDPQSRPLNQDGCDNIGMDYRKQCVGHAEAS